MPSEKYKLQILEVAAHEMGHAYIGHVLGLEILEIRVRPGIIEPDGWCALDTSKITTPEHLRSNLISLLAGCETSRAWSDERDRHHDEAHCDFDIQKVRRIIATDPWVEGVTEREIRHEARTLVRSHWTTINWYAEQLAARGTLSL